MDGDFLTTWAWVFWLAVILVFLVVEVMSLEFTFLMLAVGSLGGLVAGLIGVPWWAQIIVAGVLAVILIFFVRPALHTFALRRGADPAKSNVEGLLGLQGSVVVAFADGQGQVKLANGETWTSRLADDAGETALTEGEKVVVTAIDGATAVVVPATTTAPDPVA